MRYMAISIGALAVALTLPTLADAQSSAKRPTFYKDVMPIMQENCQECHRQGGANLGGMVAPMEFTSYQKARPWAKAIAKAVSTKRMPPWDASTEHAGVFMGERVLTQDQIDTIVAWVESGAQQGSKKDAPEPKVFPGVDGWSIGEPDVIFSMPEPFFVPDDLYDATKYFKMTLSEEQMPEDRWIKAVEFRPGSEAVHHIIARPIGGIAPGNTPHVYRDGYSAKLKKGEEIVWNMHYHKEPGPGTGMWDQSSVGVTFYPKGYEPKHVLTTQPLGTFDIDIPAYEAKYSAKATYTFEKDSLISSLMPHMHLRGTEVKYTLFYPDGTEEVMLHVPEYDFNWQNNYRFKEPKLVPAKTRVEFEGWWDNSAENASNPDPSQRITWGEATHEEMMFGWLSFTNPDEDATAHQGFEQNRSSSDD